MFHMISGIAEATTGPPLQARLLLTAGATVLQADAHTVGAHGVRHG